MNYLVDDENTHQGCIKEETRVRGTKGQLLSLTCIDFDFFHLNGKKTSQQLELWI
jgi:hypothetical protein